MKQTAAQPHLPAQAAYAASASSIVIPTPPPSFPRRRESSPIDCGVAAPYILNLGLRDYTETWHAMRRYSRRRFPASRDQLWLVEHPPIYTLGRGGDVAHVADAGDVPVVRSDRGGQATYHGPGQTVLYALLNLRGRDLSVRRCVALLEEAVIELLRGYGVVGKRRPGLPGVYVGGRKIASIGLCVSRGCCYHGVALNVDMDLHPFGRIVVCGDANAAVTQLRDLGVAVEPASAGAELARRFTETLENEYLHRAVAA